MTFIKSTSEAEKILGLKHELRISENREAALAILVHGRAGNLSVMSLFQNSVPASWHILRVEAPLVDPIGGYSWWLADAPNKHEMIISSTDLLISFVQSATAYYGLLPKKVIGVGFSQGGVLLSLVLQEAPSLLDGLGLIASFAAKSTRALDVSLSQPVFIAHGTADSIVTIDKAISGKEYLEQLGANVEFHTDDYAHKIGTNGMRALKTWFASLDI